MKGFLCDYGHLCSKISQPSWLVQITVCENKPNKIKELDEFNFVSRYLVRFLRTFRSINAYRSYILLPLIPNKHFFGIIINMNNRKEVFGMHVT